MSSCSCVTIRVSSSVLCKELVSISGVISSRPLVPILEDFLFSVDDNVLTITVSDLQTFVVTKMSVESSGDVKIAIPSRILIDTLKNLPDQPIAIKITNDTNIVEIITSNGKYKIVGESAVRKSAVGESTVGESTVGESTVGESAESYPRVKMNNADDEIIIDSGVLKKTLQTTIIAASSDPLKPIINSVCFDFSVNKMVVVSTDTHRLIKCCCNIANDKIVTLVIPKKSLQVLINLINADCDTTISFNSHYVCIKNDKILLFSTLLNGRFPDYERAIPKGYRNQLKVSRIDMIETLKRVATYVNMIKKQVQMTVENNKITVIADDFNLNNQAIETIECSCNFGFPLSICFNVKYLQEILQGVNSDEVTFWLSDVNESGISNKAAVVHPSDQVEDCFVEMLIMPMFV